jgi:hypothetical protein
MKILSTNDFLVKVFLLIKQKQPIHLREITKRLHTDEKSITEAVRYLRILHKQDRCPYVYRGPEGYTLKETRRTVAFQFNRGLNLAIGQMASLNFVAGRYRKIALLEFKQVSMEYKSKLLSTARGLLYKGT